MAKASKSAKGISRVINSHKITPKLMREPQHEKKIPVDVCLFCVLLLSLVNDLRGYPSDGTNAARHGSIFVDYSEKHQCLQELVLTCSTQNRRF